MKRLAVAFLLPFIYPTPNLRAEEPHLVCVGEGGGLSCNGRWVDSVGCGLLGKVNGETRHEERFEAWLGQSYCTRREGEEPRGFPFTVTVVSDHPTGDKNKCGWTLYRVDCARP